MELPTRTSPDDKKPSIDEHVRRALDDLFDAFARAYGGATIVQTSEHTLFDNLGSEREDVEAVIGLEPTIRERLVRMEDWPEASDEAKRRFEERFDEAQALTDDERRLVADMMVGTFLAAAELVGPDPDHARLERAKVTSDRHPAPSRLIGKPLGLLDCTWYLGLYIKES